MSTSEISKYIDSGILEMYVFGSTSPEQTQEVEQMVKAHEQIRAELYNIEVSLENYALSQAKLVDPTIKPFLMATIKYMDRMSKGEAQSFPPKLHKGSLVKDFNPWLERADLGLTEALDEIDAHIIGLDEAMTTAIVWIRNGAPPEIHKKELESFLIVEGSCNIVVDGMDNYLMPGDVFTIPLNLSHHVLITSKIPCKIVLQRIAA
jgi:mannose-6-phosphate isomerase-like protein (cupin superfamily)